MIAYLATCMDLYGTPYYEQGAARAKAAWPEVTEWIEPALMGWSLSAWESNWEEILPDLDLLVVIPRNDEHHTIGRGVEFEMLDCWACGIPTVVLLDSEWVTSFEIKFWKGESYRYSASVKRSDVDPARFQRRTEKGRWYTDVQTGERVSYCRACRLSREGKGAT